MEFNNTSTLRPTCRRRIYGSWPIRSALPFATSLIGRTEAKLMTVQNDDAGELRVAETARD
jgi:hypothetical protein